MLRFRSPSSQSCCNRTMCKVHTSHAGQLGRARVTSTISYTLPAYNYTTIRHGTRSAVSSGVASMTDRLRPKPSASIYPDRVSGNRTHALSVWTYVTACRCGVHATWEGSVRLGRHWSPKRAQSAPSRRLPPTTRLGAGRALRRKPHNFLPSWAHVYSSSGSQFCPTSRCRRSS